MYLVFAGILVIIIGILYAIGVLGNGIMSLRIKSDILLEPSIVKE